MPAKERVLNSDKTGSSRRSVILPKEDLDLLATQQPHPAAIIQRAQQAPSSLTPGDLLQLQRTIGNQAVGRLLSGLEQRSDPPRRPDEQEEDGAAGQAPRPALAIDGPGKGVIQRKVLVWRTVKHLFKKNEKKYAKSTYKPPTQQQKNILKNWNTSPTEHKFSSEGALKKALDRAEKEQRNAEGVKKTSGKDVPDLYTQTNLKFLTQDTGRLPTLYFLAGNTSGRIRQQHGSGPAVVSQDNKVDYFFADDAAKRSFARGVRHAKRHGQDFDPDVKVKKTGASRYTFKRMPPTAGDFHVEVTYQTASVPGQVAKVHISGGLAQPVDKSAYPDQEIQKIYEQAIGKRV